MSQIRQYDILFSSGILPYVELTQTLNSGANQLIFTDNRVHQDSVVAVYSDVFGVDPTDMTVARGTITLTFDTQERDHTIMVRFT